MAEDNNEICSLVSLLSRFQTACDHPETFLKPPSSLEKDTVNIVKGIFDFCKKDEPSGSRSLANTCPLQELLVDDFDVEQIWQEIELQNTPLLHLGRKDVDSAKQNPAKVSLLSAGSDDYMKRNRLENRGDDMVGENASESENDSIDKESSHDESFDDQIDDDEDNDDNDEDDDYEYRDDNVHNKKASIAVKDNRKHKPSVRKSQVDDTFFKLSDMLQFLDKEDRRFERACDKKSKKESDDDDDSDQSDSKLVDYFVDMDSDDTDEEEDEDWNEALGATESLVGRCIS